MALKYLIDLDLSGNELQNASLQSLDGAPSNPALGQIYFDTGLKGVFINITGQADGWRRVGLTADGTTIVEDGGEISVGTIPMTSVEGLGDALEAKVDDSQVLTNVPANALFTDTLYTAGSGLSLASEEFSVDGTVVRTTGDQAIGGNKTFRDNVTVEGDLVVTGTTTTVNSTEVTLADNILTLASNALSPGEVIESGIEVNRGPAEEKPRIFYVESEQRWFQQIPGMEEGVPIAFPGEFDTNTQRSNEEIRDVIGGTLVGGGATTVTVDDPNNTITISSTNSTYSAGTGINLSGGTFSNQFYNGEVVLDPVATAGYFEVPSSEAVTLPSLMLQVKEIDLITNSAKFVMTEWDIPADGAPARVFLPVNDANKVFAVSFSGILR